MIPPGTTLHDAEEALYATLAAGKAAAVDEIKDCAMLGGAVQPSQKEVLLSQLEFHEVRVSRSCPW